MATGDQNTNRASFESSDLEELTRTVKGAQDIRDRKYGVPPKTYAKCFVGSEAVRKMVARPRPQALL
jgi:hypothetical protein